MVTSQLVSQLWKKTALQGRRLLPAALAARLHVQREDVVVDLGRPSTILTMLFLCLSVCCFVVLYTILTKYVNYDDAHATCVDIF